MLAVKAPFVGGLVGLLVAGVLACAAFAAPSAESKVGCESLAHRLPHLEARLPVAIAVATPCGHFLVERSGAVVRSRPAPRPVPAGAGWYPDLTWYRFVRGHLLIGVRHRLLWRSTHPLATRYNLGAIERAADEVAFSLFYGSASKLFVARFGGVERLVGRGETPIGWTRTGDLIAVRYQQLPSGHRPESLVLLAPSGQLLHRIAVDVWDWAWAKNRSVLLSSLEGMPMRAKPWDVSGGLWGRIEPLLPRRKRRFRYPGRKPFDDRLALQGILFVLHTGGWEHLPQELGFGCGMTAWRRLRAWQDAVCRRYAAASVDRGDVLTA
jgi:Putative transposase of IS4/5 family (DUF4096)